MMNMRESGPVDYFQTFLEKYFSSEKIIRHPEYKIQVKNKTKRVKPDFLVDEVPKLLVEFKELEASQVKDSHRQVWIDWAEEPTDPNNPSRWLPNIGGRCIEGAIRKANDQLKPAEAIECPGVLVIYTKYRGLQLMMCRQFPFSHAMYRYPDSLISKNAPMNKCRHISAIAYFSVDVDNPNKMLYAIRFYHNTFANRKMPIEPFIDSKCQHYIIENDLTWRALLNHEERLGP